MCLLFGASWRDSADTQKRFWRADWIFFSRPHLARFFPRPSGVTTCNEKQRAMVLATEKQCLLGAQHTLARTEMHTPTHWLLAATTRGRYSQSCLREEEISAQRSSQLSQRPKASMWKGCDAIDQVLLPLRQLMYLSAKNSWAGSRWESTQYSTPHLPPSPGTCFCHRIYQF